MTVVSEWKKGSSIVWRGKWEGKEYEDKGKFSTCKPSVLSSTATTAPFQDFPTIRRTITR